MGWLPSIFGGGDKPADPVSQLDPSLREYMRKEAPAKYSPDHDTRPTATAKPAEIPIPQPVEKEEEKPKERGLPQESLYQDGRYKDLWKTYRPLAEIEAESATDHDQISQILDEYKERKAAVGRAALENCSFAQEDWANCMKNGTYADRAQMCRHQVRRFEKCHVMQSRFLRALGYATVPGRSADVEDEIQMHAFALWQKVLKHEDDVAKAKEAGVEPPKFDPSIRKTSTPSQQISEETKLRWREKLSKLADDERVAEEAALRADLEIDTRTSQMIKGIRDAKEEERVARQTQGKGTFGDAINLLLGPFGKK